MKTKRISLSTIAAVVIAASSICVTETVRAQGRDSDSGIGSNPHLRSKSMGQAASSPGTSTTVKKMSQKDVSFIQKAAGGGAQEVENGKMAEKQAKSAEVKSIAARMVADHTRANNELTELAKQKGVTFRMLNALGPHRNARVINIRNGSSRMVNLQCVIFTRRASWIYSTVLT